MKVRSFAVALALVAAAALFAQVRETVNVNVIEVPVTVVDSSGNPIRGLTAANFELFDQGRKRAISSFDKIDFGTIETVTAISPLNPAARRTFLLLFDLGFSSPNSLTRAQESARNFVKENVKPRDLVGVGTIEVDRGFRLLSAFTTDRELIASTIADPIKYRGADPLQIANQTVAFKIGSDPAAPASPAPAEGRAAMGEEYMKETAQRMKSNNEQYARSRIEKQVDALGELAKMLRAVPGRKQIIMLSEGFDAKYVQGREARASAEQAKENAAVLSGAIWEVDSDKRYGSTSSMSMVDRMAQLFRSSDAVLHAVDIQGVRVQNDVNEGARINSNAGLFALSRPTGGEVFQNSNDLKNNFTRLLHQQEVVYVLGFQAPTSKPGAFHELRVKLVNVPGGRISHRAGYYEAGGETPGERSLRNAEIIINDIAQDGVRVAALAAAFPIAGGNSQVPVILDLNGNDLAKEAKNGVAAAEIFVYAFDTDGVVRDRLYQRLSLDMNKVGEKLRATGVRYYGTLNLPPGTYAVKSLVRAGEGEKRGFARVDITVPKANDMAVLPLIPIDEAPKWVLVRGTARFNAPYPFELSGQDFIPSAQAQGHGGKVALIVYGAKPDELTWETTPKTKTLGQAGSGAPAKYVLQLDDAGAASTLDITVRKKGLAEPQKTSVAVAKPAS
ncbi:MAG: VWA domain-containing protein [Acidobacteriota bacterium]